VPRALQRSVYEYLPGISSAFLIDNVINDDGTAAVLPSSITSVNLSCSSQQRILYLSIAEGGFRLRPGQLTAHIASISQSPQSFGQKSADAALNALKTQLKTHGQEIFATGSQMRQAEKLLGKLSVKHVRRLSAIVVYRFLESRLPTVESDLTVLRSSVSREHQTLIKATWEKLHYQNEKNSKYPLAMCLQQELCHPELSVRCGLDARGSTPMITRILRFCARRPPP
jgi:hypothetical protein